MNVTVLDGDSREDPMINSVEKDTCFSKAYWTLTLAEDGLTDEISSDTVTLVLSTDGSDIQAIPGGYRKVRTAVQSFTAEVVDTAPPDQITVEISDVEMELKQELEYERDYYSSSVPHMAPPWGAYTQVSGVTPTCVGDTFTNVSFEQDDLRDTTAGRETDTIDINIEALLNELEETE